jgi:Fic family protein
LKDGITIAGKPLREHLEAINHREAMRLMTRLAQSGTPLLETEILELHRTILTGIQSEDAGVYRTVRVRVAGSMRIFPNPVKVPELMGAFVEDVNAMQSHPVVIAARAHYGLVAIHPGADGV